ncbi:PTS system mannose/fructose/sorbose family transporter subunit IID [Fundidesulfovibrio terrae]|uniref:PTS system mannose/fructose/sorbose family transporter subunit IID n=1 Tax=Fundidesulfovibrio terrae TaxID=2922866 RepID=UPI001FB00745|nr:PTS system mannose/fructose/sorbose family transporter subunit IID [Fundidesulfovibrio terrae]
MSTPGALNAKILIRTYLRCYFVGAAFTTRGLQTIGLALAMEPGLAALYPDPADRRQAWKRYLKIYNTHPFWTPFLVGIFLALESRIARRQFPDSMLDQVKSTVVFTLSAVGDSFFGGSLTVFWALCTACLLTAGQAWAAFGLGLTLFVALNAFKIGTFVLGYRQGFAALTSIRSWDLVNWGRRLKVLNAALLVVLWAQVWPRDMDPLAWAAGVAVVLGLAYASGRLRCNRELLVGLALAAGLFFLWIRL